MKRPFVAAAIIIALTAGQAFAGGRVYVHGYVRKDGAYVPPHYRTSPDTSFYNNWSTIGNVNPYTGKPGTKSEPSYSGRPNYIPSTSENFRFAPIPQPLTYPSDHGTASPQQEGKRFEENNTPSNIDDQIQIRAMEKWSNDFSMQAYDIKKQREGYADLQKYLATYRKLGLPNQIQQWALSNAQREWPDDYSMQAYSYEKNLDGYLRLSALISSDEWKALPETAAQWMMEISYRQWSNDFSMQAYTLEKQIDGFYGLVRLEKGLDRLPKEVADRIRRKARSAWPQDLSMQAYTEQRELDGYLELKRLVK